MKKSSTSIPWNTDALGATSRSTLIFDQLTGLTLNLPLFADGRGTEQAIVPRSQHGFATSGNDFYSAKGGGKSKPGGGGSTDGGGGTTTTFLTTYSGVDNGDPSGYDVDINFKGSLWTQDSQKPFILLTDLLEETFNDINTTSSVRYRGTNLEDLTIDATISTIDGEGGVLGQAGPTITWNSAGTKDWSMSAAGLIEFDQADATALINNDLFHEVVVHEYLHVMGFGTLWEKYGLLENDDSGQVAIYSETLNGKTNTYARYIGVEAVEAYRTFAGDPLIDYIKVEADGGSGTALGHWDEETFGNELMTGYLGGTDAWFSTFSAAALLDLGYSFATGVSIDSFAAKINEIIRMDEAPIA